MTSSLLMALLLGGAAAGQPGFEDAVRAFSHAGDQRDTQALEAVLHDDFRVVASMPDGQVSILTREVYVGLVAAKKIGGEKRSVRVEDVRVDGSLATGRVTLTSKAARFDGYCTLAKVNGRWLLIEQTVSMTPIGKKS